MSCKGRFSRNSEHYFSRVLLQLNPDRHSDWPREVCVWSFCRDSEWHIHATEPSYIPRPHPHFTKFDTEDGSSIFLRNVGIHLKDCALRVFCTAIWNSLMLLGAISYVILLYSLCEYVKFCRLESSLVSSVILNVYLDVRPTCHSVNRQFFQSLAVRHKKKKSYQVIRN